MNLYKRHLILLFFIIIRTLPGQFQILNAQSAVAGVDPSYSSSKNFITTSKSRIRIDRISEDSLSILFTSLLTEKSSPTGSAPPGHSSACRRRAPQTAYDIFLVVFLATFAGYATSISQTE
jgi:hypothetical protein